MKYDFVIRIYQATDNSILSAIQRITISNITILSKREKFGGICYHLKSQAKYGYKIILPREFNTISGSHSTPTLTFKGEYIDIIVKNFPRYPAFYQDLTAAKSGLTKYGYTNYMNKGFDNYLLYRNIEIRKQQLKTNKQNQ